MTMPITTNTTIAACIQIHVGDMSASVLWAAITYRRRPLGSRLSCEHGRQAPKADGRDRACAVHALRCCLGPDRRSQPNTAHPASTSLLGGVNIGGVGDGSLPSEADKLIAAATQLHAKLVRVEVPWSVLEPQRRPARRAARSRTPTASSQTRRRLASASIMMVRRARPAGPPRRRRRCSPDASPGERAAANAWPPREPADYATFVAYLARALRHADWRRSRSGTSPTRPTKTTSRDPTKPQRYAAILRAAYPAIKQAEPGCAGARAARSSAPTGRSCARSTRPASRATTTASPSTTTTSRSPRCARSTKCSSPTATPRRCGSTSSAGAAAGQRRRSSRNRRA